MLRELPRVRQRAGEPKRRWFFSHEIDLVVWENDDGEITAFQLAYDKPRGEHSMSWHRERGFNHYVVDDGEHGALSNATPLLYANGPFRRDHVIRRFQHLGPDVPPEIARFVEDKLREYAGQTLP